MRAQGLFHRTLTPAHLTTEPEFHRVVSALDCGHVVNPLSISMQTEGAVIFALRSVKRVLPLNTRDLPAIRK